MPLNNILLTNVASFVALYANKGFDSYIRQHFLDRTFQGLYRANAFDIALLVPYFVVLILLASYGLHRYVLVYLYYMNRKNPTSEPATRFEDLPRITVQRPLFTPAEDFLLKVIHHFTDPKIAMVQTRWTHINRNYSFLTEVEAILLDGHFVLEHSGRARSGVFFNFNGTAGMWRRRAIEEAGGWQHDTLTEDTDLSYRAQLKGWKFIYLQEVECPAERSEERRVGKGGRRW